MTGRKKGSGADWSGRKGIAKARDNRLLTPFCVRITVWVQVLYAIELDTNGESVRALVFETWPERRRQLDALGGQPMP